MSRLGSQRVRWRTELLLRLKDKNASKDVVRGTVAQLRDEALLGNARDYTAAITALGRLGDWNEAISLYSEYAARQADNFQVPDDICHTSVVSACERGSQWAAALELLFKRPVPPAGPAVAAAIGACGKGGAWQHAVSCLEGMKASKVDLNATCYGIGVSACARNDQVDASFVLLETALAEDLEPGLLSYTSMLSACGRLQRWESAIKIITTMKDRAIQPDAVCISAALSSSAFSDWQGALQLLQEAKAAQLDQERYHKAGQYLQDRKSLDVAAVNAACSVCERASQWPAALCLFDELCSTSMGLAIRPDQVSFNVAISSWGQGKHWENALRILAQMPLGQTTPDAVSYTSAVSACERALEWKHAVALLEAMKLQRIQPSVLCYGAAIGAGHWLTAFQLLEAMKADRLQASTVCFNAAINACRRDHEWQHALRLLSKMPEEAAPSIVTFNSAITCCERAFAWHAALGLMEEAHRAHQQLNVVTFGAAITACRRAMQWQRAVALMEQMIHLGIQPDPECQRVVTLALMEAGRAKEASSLLREVSGTVTGEGFQQPPRADGRGELDLQNMSAEVATVTARAAIQDAATRKFKAQDLCIILNGKGDPASTDAVAAMVRALGLPIRLAEKPTRVLVPLRAIRAKWRRGAVPEMW